MKSCTVLPTNILLFSLFATISANGCKQEKSSPLQIDGGSINVKHCLQIGKLGHWNVDSWLFGTSFRIGDQINLQLRLTNLFKNEDNCTPTGIRIRVKLLKDDSDKEMVQKELLVQFINGINFEPRKEVVFKNGHWGELTTINPSTLIWESTITVLDRDDSAKPNGFDLPFGTYKLHIDIFDEKHALSIDPFIFSFDKTNR